MSTTSTINKIPHHTTQHNSRPSSPYRRAIYDPDQAPPPHTLTTTQTALPSTEEDEKAINVALKALKLTR